MEPRRSKTYITAVGTGMFVFLIAAALSSEWPQYGGGPSRNATVESNLPLPVDLLWSYRPSAPPSPAWPQPGKELHRLDFDYAFVPISGGGRVYFGSSSDDTVRALDAATGRLLWYYVTGGPIRFAPVYHDGRVYVSSDDGCVYCLDAANGNLLWKNRPEDGSLFIGNDRLISRRCIRTGLLMVDETIYFCRGMWPSEGVSLNALEASSGKVLWKRRIGDTGFIHTPHPGAFAFTGVAPQGYIAATGDVLLVPTGRSVPAACSISDGNVLYYTPGTFKHDGGWFVCAGKGFFINPAHGHEGDPHAFTGEAPPDENDGINIIETSSGRLLGKIPGILQAALKGGLLYGSGAADVVCLRVEDWLTACRRAAREGQSPPPWKEFIEWSQPFGRSYSILLCGDTLVVGGKNKLAVLSAKDGTVLMEQHTGSNVRALAVWEKGFVASTEKGNLLCFGNIGVKVRPLRHRERLPLLTRTPAAVRSDVSALLQKADIPHGGYIVLVDDRIGYGLAFARLQDEKVVQLVDKDCLGHARRAAFASGLYGRKLVVMPLEVLKKGQLPPYMASLVVWNDHLNIPAAAVARIVHPFGGRVIGKVKRQSADTWPRGFSREARDETAVVTRNEPPGAGRWTSTWADGGNTGISREKNVKLPLRILWFGGPGPARLYNRHWRGSSPLAAKGRLFIAGEHDVICVDAYTGRRLWSTRIGNIGRLHGGGIAGGNFVTDDEAVYVANMDRCYRLDAATGRITEVYTLPKMPVDAIEREKPEAPIRWPVEWRVFGPIPRNTEIPSDIFTTPMPVTIKAAGADYIQRTVRSVQGDVDFSRIFGGYGHPPSEDGTAGPYRGPGAADRRTQGKLAVIMAELEVDIPSRLVFGMDSVGPFQAYLDGKMLYDGIGKWPNLKTRRIDVAKHVFTVELKPGKHVIGAVVAAATRGWCIRTAGGPRYSGYLTYLPETARPPLWGYLQVTEKHIIGTAVLKPRRLLFADAVFALDKKTGETVWVHRSRYTVPGSSVAVGGGKVFFLDTYDLETREKQRETAPEEKIPCVLTALDEKTGEEVWRSEEIPRKAGLFVRFASNVVVVGTAAAFDASTGKRLWAYDRSTLKPPVVRDEILIALPFAYDLQTGRRIEVTDPVTGNKRPWTFLKSYGCGFIGGCNEMLFFRSGTLGGCVLGGNGLLAEAGTFNIGGIRAGCGINAIPALGILLVPDASSGCSCSYNFQTCLALFHDAHTTGQSPPWRVISGPVRRDRIKHLLLDIGGRGDHYDRSGRLWLRYPRPPILPFRDDAVTAYPVWMYLSFAAEDISDTKQQTDIHSRGSRLPLRLRLCLYLSPAAAGKIDTPLSVDGRLTEGAWRNTPSIMFENGSDMRAPRIQAKLLRGRNALYVGYVAEAARREGKPIPFKTTQKDLSPRYYVDDCLQILVSDTRHERNLHLGITAGGAYEFRAIDMEKGTSTPIDKNAFPWHTAASAGEWSLEVELPYAFLEKAGIDPTNIMVNLKARNRSGTGPSTRFLVRQHARSFPAEKKLVPLVEEAKPTTYAVTLYLASRAGTKTTIEVRIGGKTIHRQCDFEKGRAVVSIPAVRCGNYMEMSVNTVDTPASVWLCGLEVKKGESR